MERDGRGEEVNGEEEGVEGREQPPTQSGVVWRKRVAKNRLQESGKC